MIMIFLLAQLPVGSDTLGVAKTNPDSLAVDSLAEDTIPKYKIPEVVSFADGGAAPPGALSAFPINDYDLFLSDAFAVTPSLNRDGLIYRRGNDPYRFSATLNGRPLNHRWSGYFDVDEIAIQFLDRVAETGRGIDFQTKINHYARPYSYLRFTALGSTTLYDLNFTRPITNEMGFYWAGLYCRTWIPRDTLAVLSRTNAYYADFYWNNFFKSRLDLIYDGRSTGDGRKNETYDAALTLGRGSVKTQFYCDAYGFSDRDSLSGFYAANNDLTYGLLSRGNHRAAMIDIAWELGGTGDNSSSETPWSGRQSFGFYYIGHGWAEVVKKIARARFALSGAFDYIDGNMSVFMPGARVEYTLADSQYLFATVQRDYRAPSLNEIYGGNLVYDPQFPFHGNPDLRYEYRWREEAGFSGRNLTLSLYKNDYHDYIYAVSEYADTFYQYDNRVSARALGVEDFLEFPVRWGFSFGLCGDYLIQADSLPSYPKYNAEFSLAWQAEKGRARYRIIGWGRYLGPRFPGGQADLRPVFSAAAQVKFITLLAALKFDNVLDEQVRDFPLSARNVSLSVKWEFWD
jgi:outer membrane receptor protein involved in Fe transport